MQSSLVSKLISWFAAGLTAFAATFKLISIVQHFSWLHLGSLFFYVLMFYLFVSRKAAETASHDWKHWVIAIGATCLPFFMTVSMQAAYKPLFMVSIPIQYIAIVLMIIAMSQLGQSFGIIAAHREVKIHGLYQVVRHPLYASELCFMLGLVLQYPTLENGTIIGLLIACITLRILEEEHLLTQVPLYQAYKKQVRYRIIPGLF
jgi:protein-S-isoprenylcysteine O-methyltransferase Ste14